MTNTRRFSIYPINKDKDKLAHILTDSTYIQFGLFLIERGFTLSGIKLRKNAPYLCQKFSSFADHYRHDPSLLSRIKHFNP